MRVSYLRDVLEGWFDRRLSRVVQRLAIEGSADSEELFGQGAVVYRVPLRDLTTRVVSVAPVTRYTVRRGLADLVGLGPRVYVADGAPASLFGKPTALFVFGGFRRRPSYGIVGSGPYFVGRSRFPPLELAEARGFAVLNEDRIDAPVRVEPSPEYLATALANPFPPTDLPNPPAGSPAPTPVPNTPAAPCSPVLLFYALCFQTPRPGEGSIEDPLAQETNNVRDAFKGRGYTVSDGLAGNHAPDGGRADTFSDMMAGLAKAIAAQTAFCNCPDDQLVIWVAAHGYAGQYNPTGEVALHFDAQGVEAPGGEWVTWQVFLDALAAIPQIAANPAKVYLLVYSCRSGRIWEGGVAPPTLKGIHVLTGAATSGQYCGQLRFSQYLVFALGWLKAQNWDHLVKLMKREHADNPIPPASSGTPYGPPTNGDLSGCRFKMTLSKVAFSGNDLGANWKYTITAGRGVTEITEHAVSFTAGETRTDVVYDRLWPPCPSSVTIQLTCGAVSVGRLYNNDGQASVTINRLCDGTAQTATSAVGVSARGYGTETVTFTFDIATTC